jgi:hypothetical protein
MTAVHEEKPSLAKLGVQSTATATPEGVNECINQNGIDFGGNPIGSAVYAEFGVARAGSFSLEAPRETSVLSTLSISLKGVS